MDQWIKANNIARFEKLLLTEADQGKRAILETLLEHERSLEEIEAKASRLTSPSQRQ